jgi:F0F1-type ATP synthase membrane subunit c/vacuolar-type H+-ATPase subunit K
VTAWIEVASLAGIGQQVVMAAMIAVDAREPLMQVTAVEKAFEDLGLYRPVD